MALYFVTGNRNKYEEVKAILGKVEWLKLNLPEIQSLDQREIIKHKVAVASAQYKGEFIVDDTSLELECLNSLPGPLVKWFLHTIGKDGLYRICKLLGNYNAIARCTIGYFNNNGKLVFFQGEVKGRIVQARGDKFGWDPVFQPDGFDKTYAEMSPHEKNSISHRSIALAKLKAYLLRNK